MAVDSRTLNLSWQPPADINTNGIIQQYVIEITETDTGSIFQLATNLTFLVVNDLHPYYEYCCTVAAETVDLGPHSAPVTILLPEDGKLILELYSVHIELAPRISL